MCWELCNKARTEIMMLNILGGSLVKLTDGRHTVAYKLYANHSMDLEWCRKMAETSLKCFKVFIYLKDERFSFFYSTLNF